jgi:hypothetical protein
VVTLHPRHVPGRQRSRHGAAPSAAVAQQTAATPALPRTGRIAGRTLCRRADVPGMLADDRSFGEIAVDLGPVLNSHLVRIFLATATTCVGLVGFSVCVRKGRTW